MFIIKFNRMIHNKWLWGAFAVVVAIIFVGSDIFVANRNQGDPVGGVGTLNGERVSIQEFDLVRQQLRMERRGDDLPERDSELQVWQRLAGLRMARQLGLTATDDELMQILRRDPAFAGSDGAFDPVRYQSVLANVLGISPQAYEEVRRNQVLINKLESAVLAGAWGVPSVAAEQARGMTDRFTVRLVTVSNTFDVAAMNIAEDELAQFHRERLAQYHVPEQVAVRYVEFPAVAYRSKVEVNEDDARDFYDAHRDRYQISTNGVTATLPYEDVRTIIESELQMQGGRELAVDAAAEFADLFYSGAVGRDPVAFERVAAEQGLSVRTTGWFAADGQVAEIDREAAFAAAAFDLNPDSPRDRYSDAVVGRDAAYVLAFHQRQEAFDPPLADVRTNVLKDALLFVRDRTFAEHVDEVHATIARETAKTRSLEEVVAELGLPISTNLTYAAVDAYRELPGGQDLAMSMAGMNAGEISPPVYVEGAAVFLQVVAREAGEDLQRRVMSGQIAAQLRNNIAELVRDDWRRFNFGRMRLETSRGPLLDVGDDVSDDAP